jgi:hypothetical protein
MEQKEFQNLRAQAALTGHALWRSDPSDGHVCFFLVGLDGVIHHCWDSIDVERQLAQASVETAS